MRLCGRWPYDGDLSELTGSRRAYPVVVTVEDDGDKICGRPLLRSLLYQFQEILAVVIVSQKVHIVHDKDKRSANLGSALERDLL